MKKLVFSEHALKRMRERGIPEEWVGEVINNAEETINARFDRRASFKKFGDIYAIVIYEEKVNNIVVVTILKVDRERLKRYGFSRI